MQKASPSKRSRVDVLVVKSGLAHIAEQRGDRREALILLSESVATERVLTADFPGDFGLKEGFAVSLGRLAALHMELRQLDRALELASEQRALLEQMTAHDPSNAKWRRLLAIARIDAARLAEGSGDVAAAREGYLDSIQGFEATAVLRPGDLEAQFDVAITYNALGDLEDSLGDFRAALVAYERALAIGERLIRRAPDAVRWRDAVATYEGKIGAIALVLNDPERAQRMLKSSLERMRALAAADSENLDLKRNLSIALGRSASMHRARGEYSRAIALYERAKALDQQLKVRAPDDAQAVTDLAITQSQLGRVYLLAGKTQEAVEAFTAALNLRRRLGELVPSSIAWRYEVGESLVALGDAAFDAKDVEKASEYFEEAVAEYRGLLAVHTENPRWQRAGAFAYNRAGGMRAALGDVAGARTHYTAAYAIVSNLAQAAPQNIVWQTDLILSLRLLAQSSTEVMQAIELNQRALALMEEMAAREELPEQFKPWIGLTQADLARLRAIVATKRGRG